MLTPDELLIAIIFLLVVGLAQLGFMMWVLTNIRSDQLTIRVWIAKQLRERRTLMGAPMEDEAFFNWLRDHPDRPYRDDPPVTGVMP
jgi:hypothetical protein